MAFALLVPPVGLRPPYATSRAKLAPSINEGATPKGVPFERRLTRRTKASIIYRATGNLRAVQILLGHSKIENTVRYLGIDVEDTLALAENTEI